MYKFRRISIKLMSIIVCVLLTSIMILNIEKNNKVIAFSYDDVLLNENFEDDNVIVVLNSEISKINKVHSVKSFAGVEIKSIIDLSKRDYNCKNENNDFKQILQINLKEKDKKNVLKTISHLKKLRGVFSVEPNYIFETAIDPNDPEYVNDKLWGLNGTNGINVENAWNFTTGNSKIRVGIIDTGISNHVDLNANLVSGVDTFNDNDITNDDTHSHGTHVAGTIGAVGNNETGVVGVNWNVSLVPLQASNTNNTFSSTDVISAIEWAQDRWGTDEQISIINYSVSGFGNSTAIRTAISKYNGLFIWAAGNETTDIDERVNLNGSFNLDNIISVGALNSDGTRRFSSNYSTNNSNVHIYAPGTNIYSTVPTTYSSLGYSYKSGTSMAAPHVTGVAALLLSTNEHLTTSQLKQAILKGADQITISIPNKANDSDATSEIDQKVLKLNAYNSVKYVLNNYGSSTTLKYNSKSLSKVIDSTSTFFNEKNYFLKMNVENSYEYDFTISSSSSLEVTLYDSNFNKINVLQTSTNEGLTKTFSYDLLVGTYYLQSNYVSPTARGTINVSITGEPHTHSYSMQYYNYKWHKLTCECGQTTGSTQGHTILQSEIINERYAECLGCHHLLDLKFDIALIGGINSTSIMQVSINGSYILPSGIIALVDEDLDAYLNGILVFYDKDKVPMTQ